MEKIDTFILLLYIIFCVFQLLWILYDILNMIIKKCTYDVVEAEIWQLVRGRYQERNSATEYHIRLKYFYDNKTNFYTTKWQSNFLLPKEGQKRKIYINKRDASKVYYCEFKIFIFFILFRLVFLVPLIKYLIR